VFTAVEDLDEEAMRRELAEWNREEARTIEEPEEPLGERSEASMLVDKSEGSGVANFLLGDATDDDNEDLELFEEYAMRQALESFNTDTSTQLQGPDALPPVQSTYEPPFSPLGRARATSPEGHTFFGAKFPDAYQKYLSVIGRSTKVNFRPAAPPDGGDAIVTDFLADGTTRDTTQQAPNTTVATHHEGRARTDTLALITADPQDLSEVEMERMRAEIAAAEAGRARTNTMDLINAAPQDLSEMEMERMRAEIAVAEAEERLRTEEAEMERSREEAEMVRRRAEEEEEEAEMARMRAEIAAWEAEERAMEEAKAAQDPARRNPLHGTVFCPAPQELPKPPQPQAQRPKGKLMTKSVVFNDAEALGITFRFQVVGKDTVAEVAAAVGAAKRQGLCVGDTLMLIQGQLASQMTPDAIAELVQRPGRPIALTVGRPA